MSLRAFISRGIVKVLSSSTAAQTAQARLNTGELVDGLEYQEPYGFTSTAPKNKRECVALFLDGERGNGLIINISNRQYRLKNLGEGEIALYDDKNQYIKILQNGVIHAKANTEVKADCPLFRATGNVRIEGNLEVMGTSKMTGLVTTAVGINNTSGNIQSGSRTFETHTHSGVQSGSGNTGVPN